MNGRLVFLPLLWGSAATQVITEQTGIALGLVITAIAATWIGARRANRKERQAARKEQRIQDRLERLEDDVIELKGKRK